MNDGATKRRLATAATAAVLAAVVLVLLSQAHSPDRANDAVPRADPFMAPEVATTSTAPAAPSVETAPALAAIAPATVSPAAAAKFDEPELMRLLRSARGNDPALAVELAREGNRRFPTSPDAPERAAVLVHSLAEQGLASEARGEAEDMVNRYPDSAWVQEIERFTGAHRHRNVRVNAAGQLEFYDPPS